MRKEITFDQLIRWVGTGLLIIAILLLVNYLSNVLLPFTPFLCAGFTTLRTPTT